MGGSLEDGAQTLVWLDRSLKRAAKAMTRSRQAVLLSFATLGCVLLLPVGMVGAVASPIVFEDPYNLEKPIAWIAFILALSLWIVCIAAPYGAWVAFAKRRQPLQWIAIGAPFVWFAATAVSLMLAKV